MRDFLKGTMGCVIQIILGIVGIIFMVLSFVSCGNEQTGIGTLYLILTILCWSAVGGIRYWLGHIFRQR
ncbi:hypothetical protein ES707_07381 [subsurface metagenome]